MLTFLNPLKHKGEVLFASLIIEQVPEPPIKDKAGTNFNKKSEV